FQWRALHSPLRSGERDAAERVPQRAQHRSGTEERVDCSYRHNEGTSDANPKSERLDPIRRFQTADDGVSLMQTRIAPICTNSRGPRFHELQRIDAADGSGRLKI